MSFFAQVPAAPPDPIFAINALYVASQDPKKINLSIGAYRDENGKPWVLPCVQKAEEALVKDPVMNHEYLPIEGNKDFTHLSAELILGSDSPVIKSKEYAVVQSVSGTGALRVAMEYFRNYLPGTVYCSKPTWGNHHAIAHEAQLKTAEYRYWNAKTRGLDIEGMLQDLENAPNGSIIVLHGCAHNPTGVDPTQDQWKQIAQVMQKKKHFPFFDVAYQGFASGDLNKDAWSVRYFVSLGMECFIAQSYSKNFGLYGERTGALVAVCHDNSHLKQLQTQLERLTRALVSNCPKHGSLIVARVLSNDSLRQEWYNDLKIMSGRIEKMRHAVKQRLDELKTPGDWSHITSQIGMFSYTGLDKNQCQVMRDKFSIFLTDNGRISVAGLNEKNVNYFAESLDWIVRNTKSNL